MAADSGCHVPGRSVLAPGTMDWASSSAAAWAASSWCGSAVLSGGDGFEFAGMTCGSTMEGDVVAPETGLPGGATNWIGPLVACSGEGLVVVGAELDFAGVDSAMGSSYSAGRTADADVAADALTLGAIVPETSAGRGAALIGWAADVCAAVSVSGGAGSAAGTEVAGVACAGMAATGSGAVV